MNTLNSKLKDAIACLPAGKYAIAVSGGSDSLALLYLMSDYELFKGSVVVHFDHNVREESSEEALFVKNTAESLGFIFEKEIWNNPQDYKGNFYQSAREKRYKFFKKIVDKYSLKGVVVAHSKTDLAETFLMRLGKGLSVKGASFFAQGVEVFKVKVFRPLLDFSRKDLQNYLVDKNISWKIDPSNKNLEKFRPRIRSILPKLDEIGISLNGIKLSLEYLSQGNEALDFYTYQEFKKLNYSKLGFYKIEIDTFNSIPLEIKIRIINQIISKFHIEYQHLPRRKNLIKLLRNLLINTKIQEINILRFEIIDKNLFIMPNNLAPSREIIASIDKNLYNVFYLTDLDKKDRYSLIRAFDLQFLPKNIRNIIPFAISRGKNIKNCKSISYKDVFKVIDIF